ALGRFDERHWEFEGHARGSHAFRAHGETKSPGVWPRARPRSRAGAAGSRLGYGLRRARQRLAGGGRDVRLIGADGELLVAARLDEGAAVLLERDAIAALRLALFARRRGLDERLAELLGERLVAAGSFQECPARLGAVI